MAKKRFYGSLARRIVLVTVLLIVIPMGIYSFLSWQRDWRIRLSSTFGQLELIGKANLQMFEEWYLFRSAQLRSIAFLTRNSPNLEKVFTNPDSLGHLSTIFVLVDGKFKFASIEEMLGKPMFYQEGLDVVEREGEQVFVYFHPFTKREELFLLKKMDQEIWGLSVSIDRWAKLFALFKESGYPISLSFIGKNNKVQFTTHSEKDLRDAQIFSLSQIENWKRMLSFQEIQTLRRKDLGVRIPLEHSLFNLQIDIPAEKVTHVQGTGFFAHLMVFFIFFVCLGVLGTIWLVSRMARPLHQLYSVMDAVAVEDYTRRYQKDHFGFEINDLGENFNRMLDSLLENVEEAKRERVARELLSRELDIGHEVQKELLPRQLPQFPGLKIGGGFVPAKNVGGDFYDLFPIDDGHLFLTIADGSDKGISACLYALMVRSMLRSHAVAENDLKTIVTLTNQLFCQDTGMTGNFVTAWMAIFNKQNQTIQYTSAGHYPALYLDSSGEIEELNTRGIALGVQENIDVEVKEKILDSGALLFLYTDGLIEAHNEKGEPFGKSRLMEYLQSHHALESQEMIDKLMKEIHQFAKAVPQHDDLTALNIKADFSDHFRSHFH